MNFPAVWLQAPSTRAPPTAFIFSSALLLKTLAFKETGCFGSVPFPRVWKGKPWGRDCSRIEPHR